MCKNMQKVLEVKNLKKRLGKRNILKTQKITRICLRKKKNKTSDITKNI